MSRDRLDDISQGNGLARLSRIDGCGERQRGRMIDEPLPSGIRIAPFPHRDGAGLGHGPRRVSNSRFSEC